MTRGARERDQSETGGEEEEEEEEETNNELNRPNNVNIMRWGAGGATLLRVFSSYWPPPPLPLPILLFHSDPFSLLLSLVPLNDVMKIHIKNFGKKKASFRCVLASL